MLGIDVASDMLLEGYPVGWFSPTYKMLLEIWRDLVQSLAPFTTRKSVQERRIETVNGGILDMWSLDNPDTARGRRYARVVVDEAAMVPGLMDAWQLVIRPTLVDYQGDGFFLSTPKGRNAFWQMFQWGIDDNIPDWHAWQMPTNTNPYISGDEIEAMRKTSPEMVFRQEILAEFIEDFGGVFRRVMEAATAEPLDRAAEGGQYVIGVDWGRSNDFTVITVLDINRREMVYLDRFTQIDYNIQASRLRGIYQRFPNSMIIAESNSMGLPIIERLQMEGLPISGFMTTSRTKEPLIRGLESAFENGEIRILNDPVLIGELQAYEQEQLTTYWRFGAPEGMHDDCVISLALAWHGIGAGCLSFSIGDD
jgi:hypothetical protein